MEALICQPDDAYKQIQR